MSCAEASGVIYLNMEGVSIFLSCKPLVITVSYDGDSMQTTFLLFMQNR